MTGKVSKYLCFRVMGFLILTLKVLFVSTEIKNHLSRLQSSLTEVNADNVNIVAHIFKMIPKIAAEEGLTNGYRVVSNCGPDAGQTVHHLHFHILGGKELTTQMA